MKSTFKLFRIAGIAIGIHYTWLFALIFFSWTLAMVYFPSNYPGWSSLMYWIMGIIGALLIFVSVLVHELAHSLVSKTRGTQVSSITLFILGGASNLDEEPERPAVEFIIAIVGPATSLILGAIFFAITHFNIDPTTPLYAIISYLSIINIYLGIFNLLPGFPLDGGRVLRSLLWGSTGSLAKATDIASIVGQFFGWAFIALGVYLMISVNFIAGLWFTFIGWFLNSSADASRKEVALRERLGIIKVKELMNENVATINPETTVQNMVTNIFRKQHGRAVPVCKDGKMVGIATISDIKKVKQEKWATTPVKKIMTTKPLYTVAPEDNLNKALLLIAKYDVNQVLINNQGKCGGLLSRADVIRLIQMNTELGIK
ncbi:MAG: site-2 protease family protein [Dehalococcoidales bacterium]|nr:site-2 protease family protein [Dehalococcoidales bacterium]